LTRRETSRQHIQGDMMSNQSVRTQKLLDFTVKIFFRDDPDSTVGTGVVIYPAGQIITCRHVVEDAGIPDVLNPDSDGNGPATVGIYFPQLRGSTADKVRRARISGVLPQHDDDIVLLTLADAPAPKIDVAQVKQWAQPHPGAVFHAAPQPLADWVGRADLLKALNADWADPARRVTGLIGFGGETVRS
jgi:hypothetical protein